jgi:hypothetical protein
MAQELIEIDQGFSANIETLVDKAFYGLRQDTSTGRAYIDIIKGDEPIRLPNEYENRPDDYLNWMWSHNTFRYSFDTNTGRLQLEVL